MEVDDQGVEHKRKNFKNGDNYEGGWKNGLPEGTGKYLWTDGSTYVGEWKSGVKHGIGSYMSPNGGEYTGEWAQGCRQGYGTYKAANGSKYQGGWVNDLKHGLGKKYYYNGDKYDGIWRQGKPEGPGTYVWSNGHAYNGEWKGGLMHGQGTFQWKSGERYDGEWKDGRENGLGTFQWKDNSTYNGMFQAGKKHGIGLFRPPHVDNRRATAPLGSTTPDWSDGSSTFLDSTIEDEVFEEPLTAPSIIRQYVGTHPDFQNYTSEIFLREYEHGRVVYHTPINLEDKRDKEILFAVFRKEEPGRLRRILTKAVEKDKGPGETIYKEHRSYDIMLNLQLGIQYSVGKMNLNRHQVGLSEQHFEEKIKVKFPRRGSNCTPCHMSNDFKWKDYAPLVFRKLRESFGVNSAEYLMSICGTEALRELPSPGKSGSMFYVSHDSRFMIKTLKKAEMKHFFTMLKKYYKHMTNCKHSLVTKYYGLHRITPYKSPKIRFVVMGNLFNTDLPIHWRYDLKGSTYGRFTKGKNKIEEKSSTTLKDLDLNNVFKLEEGWHERLHHQLQLDAKFLRSINVLDYSLLLGVHHRKTVLKQSSSVVNEGESGIETDRLLEHFQKLISLMKLDKRRSQELLKLAELKLKSRTTKRSCTREVLARPPKRNNTMRPVAYSEGGSDALAFFLNYDHVQLGNNMAATAAKMDKASDDVEDVVLYFGIIDILQDYNLSKKLEHSFKSIIYDGATVSVADPTAYANRFIRFMKKVFQ